MTDYNELIAKARHIEDVADDIAVALLDARDEQLTPAPAASEWTLYDCAMTYNGIKEIPGERHHPLVVAMLHEFANWVYDDETAWCGAFVGAVCRRMGYLTPGPEPWRALQARRWLTVGHKLTTEVSDSDAKNDVIVVMKRGGENQPGPDVLDAQGHVGFLAGFSGSYVRVLGGNQRSAVNISDYRVERVLGYRRMVRA